MTESGGRFTAMFCCISKPAVVFDTFSSYKGAGVLFVEGPVALAGIHKKFKLADPTAICRLSGFGGRSEAGDIDWFYTAWRETVEELFHIQPVPIGLISNLRQQITVHPSESNGYIQIRCTFADLTQFLKICASFSLVSELYKKMPRTVDELILGRSPSFTSEIGALALLPITRDLMIDPDFQTDLAALRKA